MFVVNKALGEVLLPSLASRQAVFGVLEFALRCTKLAAKQECVYELNIDKAQENIGCLSLSPIILKLTVVASALKRISESGT